MASINGPIPDGSQNQPKLSDLQFPGAQNFDPASVHLSPGKAQDCELKCFDFMKEMQKPGATSQGAMQSTGMQKVLDTLQTFCTKNPGNPGSQSCLKTLDDFKQQLQKPDSPDNNKILIQKTENISYAIAGLVK
ncbi:MAG: hypothetical protein JHC93_01085 [Parachlamydiales bacterium]|nr:hypothetical protein [Parachlamydiales bacterium]